MGDIQKDEEVSAEQAGETRLRGRTLTKNQIDTPPTDTDLVVRTDDDKDTLYDDGLDLEDKSDPLTGVNGEDDSQRDRE